MAIELSPDARAAARASIQKYFLETRDETLGNLAADEILRFVLAELGPTIYNQGVAAAQERMQARVAELDLEVHEDEFQYWRKPTKGRK
jgi:uncharacterized protein (DUF2164 family)